MKKYLLLIVLQLASNGADSYFTNRNLHRWNFHEDNPLARPFVRSTRGIVAWNAGQTGAFLLGEYELRRHHHEKLAATIAIGNIGGHTFGAAYSAVGPPGPGNKEPQGKKRP